MRVDYLEGTMAPVREETTLTDLAVTGALPERLNGRYLRNGPNPIGEIDPAAYHWFTGDGMVHGVRLRDGRAEWYRNRWVRGPRAARLLGEPDRPAGGAAGMDLVGANTNVIGHAGRTLALVEGGITNLELTDELDTVGPCDFDGTLAGGYTAHPKRDPRTGELHAVSYSFTRGDRVQYSVIDVHGRARRTVDIPVGGSLMMHDFALTERHVVIYDLPVTFDADRVARASFPAPVRVPARLVIDALVGRVRIPDPIAASVGRRGSGAGLPYRWDPRRPARVGVMPREGGADDVRWFEIGPCYVFHSLNAYDDGDTVVCDVVRHPKMFDTDLNGPNEGRTSLDRWIIDLAAGKVVESRRDDRYQEFPRVDERLTGHRHRYGYAVEVREGAGPSDTLLKHDLVEDTVRSRSFGPDKAVGEFVFDPAAPDAAEDDGVLLGLVSDLPTGTTDLTVLDAATLETIAAVHIPARVPAGFHGNWVPSA
ncbi:carotenoid oxygenase family protein [Thermomonospora umbrina]|uniref:Dioxygenase n=1 Tax=Thermomonospora umbrina TaxID=111806 RepID=A0A3D9T3L7_9ACTN|nr:carotenoid oxygenase family protein [Thermomonospora umbrina]REE99845.1 carotenoid cleavage dioxygenase [Thermomonospora umbrina]